MTERGSPSHRTTSITSNDDTTTESSSGRHAAVHIPHDPHPRYRDAAANRRTFPEEHKEQNSCMGKLCIWSCVFLFLVILLLLLLYVFLEPKLPKVSVHSFVVDSVVPGFQTEFRVAVNISNPNRKSAILYKKGDVALLFYDHTQLIGNGSFPSFYQPRNEFTDVQVLVKQSNSNGALQILDIEKLLKQATHQDYINLVLSLILISRFDRWSVIWGDQTLAVDCHFPVSTLAKGSTLLHQGICTTDKFVP